MGSSSNLVAKFVAEAVSPAVADRQDFRKLGKSKLLTSSATQLNAAIRWPPAKICEEPVMGGLLVDAARDLESPAVSEQSHF